MHAKSDSAGFQPRILAFATQGAGGGDERRIRSLLERLKPEIFPFRRESKLRSCARLLRRVFRQRPDLLIMEGTGVAGGLACLVSRLVHGIPYVVSSGDAVSPWVGSHYPLLRPLFAIYERALYRFSSGFVGWTPYLVGRALSFGSPRGMTAPGWAGTALSSHQRRHARVQVRAELGIPPDAIVLGIVGSLAWHRRLRYCYGWELVEAMRRLRRKDVCALIVGEGSGLERLKNSGGSALGRTIFLPGAVPHERVPHMLAASDIGSLPQSVDGVGSFRYTTKLSEYLAARLPIMTGQIPLAYDLDEDWMWRLPGKSPWDEAYVAALVNLVESLTPEMIAEKRARVPWKSPLFDRDRQTIRAAAFVGDLLENRSKKAG